MTSMGLVSNYAGLLACRWFLGLAEAGLFPGKWFPDQPSLKLSRGGYQLLSFRCQLLPFVLVQTW